MGRELAKSDAPRRRFTKVDLGPAGIDHASRMLAATQLPAYIQGLDTVAVAYTYVPIALASRVPSDLKRSIWETSGTGVTQREINVCASLVARRCTRLADTDDLVGLFDDPMCAGETLKVASGARFRPRDGRLYVLERDDFTVEHVYALFDQVAHEWGGGGLFGIAPDGVRLGSISPILFLCQAFDGEAMMWCEFSRNTRS